VPRFGVSTKDAFSWFEPRAGRRRARIGPGNDLQPAVVGRHPGIGRLVRALARSGATLAAMSGSGSAVFGLFPTRAGAVRAASLLSGGRTAPRVFVTRTVGRRAYQRLAAAHRRLAAT
jgi:4-diphosphocytidyl-2C-methyl-D-erythritol kinase